MFCLEIKRQYQSHALIFFKKIWFSVKTFLKLSPWVSYMVFYDYICFEIICFQRVRFGLFPS